MRRAAAVFLFAVMAFSGGCAPPEAYIRADQATFDAIAPRYRAYVEADPALGPEEKLDHLGLLRSWEIRLREAKR